jgi:dTDP-4-amino-4,6-dideoxygalactose transaminase
MKHISWWQIELSDLEIELTTKALKNKNISQGIVTEEFESKISELLGIPYVTACTSGSTALLMSLVAAKIGPGDEVIVPNRTWIATAHAVMMVGAKVVLADDDGEDSSIFLNQINKKINSRTKAIIPVHLCGRSCDINGLKSVLKKRNVLIIEDAAQAFMSSNQNGFLGTQGLTGCFSLSLAKLISTGQGGFVVTKDKKVFERLKSLRNHGVNDPVNVSYKGFGFNFRFNDILASIGIAQLKRLKNNIYNIKTIYTTYLEGLHNLRGIRVIEKRINDGEIPLYAEILCECREKLIKYLKNAGIQTRPYYPNLNLAPQLRDRRRFPKSEKYGINGLFLPCGPAQQLKNVNITIQKIHDFSKQQ